MSWAVLFIVLAIAMVVGPIMMFKPSARSRHLEALRAEAAAAGLKIRTTYYESRNKRQSVVVYSQFCEMPFGLATLRRHEFPHDIHFYKEWHWHECDALSLTDAQSHYLKGLLQALPASVVGVEMSPNSVGIWWRETQTDQWSVPQLVDSLQALKTLTEQ